MTCNITATPLEVEPLPLYQRDPETSSLLSSAPSYTSEAPTYRSSSTQNNPNNNSSPSEYYVSTSLLDISTPPPARSRNTNPAPPRTRPSPSSASYAPPSLTSQGAAPTDADILLQHNYNIGAWSSVSGSHARRQYERVAMRRASRAAGGGDRANAMLENMRLGEEPLVPAAAAVGSWNGGGGGGGSGGGGSPVGGGSRVGTPSPSSLPVVAATTTTTGSEGMRASGVGGGTEEGGLAGDMASVGDGRDGPPEPILPHEDPVLVGEEAAARAREQRLYREECLRRNDSVRLVQESKGWDFMLSQMADWEERERSWGRFRSEVEVRQGRIGAMGVGIGRLGGFAIGNGGQGGNRRWSLGRGRFGSR